MSRWGKTVVVPLDSLVKEKESTERIARSVGTVGKWGKMGFTSTRTYALSALSAGLASSIISPGQSPASPLDDDMSTTPAEPVKPKKFFKSRNAAPPEVIAQIIQNLPKAQTSPIRDHVASTSGANVSTPVLNNEINKVKTPKSKSAERKKKTPKKTTPKSSKSASASVDEGVENGATKITPEPKPKKKKEEKKLKPEAPPSRVIPRARKAVNYCEDDDDDRMPTPIKDLIIPKSKTPKETIDSEVADTTLPPPVAPTAAVAPTTSASSKTPEHPPIVLRISKGTSRLVSTDSEEQQLSNTASGSPREEIDSASFSKSRHTSTEEVPLASLATTKPKIIVKPPKPPKSPIPPDQETEEEQPSSVDYDETPEFNYCEVKISPDKPPKERLKLIIKTDVLRHALAAAKAAEKLQTAAATPNAVNSNSESERPEKEKKQKGKKHKHLKHIANVCEQQLTPGGEVVEFKTPSPHISLSTSVIIPAEQPNQLAIATATATSNINNLPGSRTVISPPAISERDFDSQSSVLGSISSKGNSTPQPSVQTTTDECRVLHSRGSSVVTSDLETSQQSSMVAAPSDIESRLESMMMMDGEVSQQELPARLNDNETSLQKEDIIAVLRGDENLVSGANEPPAERIEGTQDNQPAENMPTDEISLDTEARSSRRRGRGRANNKTNNQINNEENIQSEEPTKIKETQPTTRTRGRKQPTASTSTMADCEPSPPKRSARRGAKKKDEELIPMEVDASPATQELDTITSNNKRLSPNKSEEENTTPVSQLQPEEPAPTVMTRRGRATRNASNNNSLSSNNNNINKIAANLSAKAGAAESEATKAAAQQNNSNASNPRTYGRKRKNQQVTQVLQPSIEELEGQQQKQATPAKVPNLDLSTSASETAAAMRTAPDSSRQANEMNTRVPQDGMLNNDLHDGNSNSATVLSGSPPRHDYKVKDKFKRTLTLDSQVNCNAVENSVAANSLESAGADGGFNNEEDEQQRGSVKLVISKKKGSIFKSRALVQPDQATEQAGVGKRHLYKHSWDAAEANGTTQNDAKSNTTASTSKANDIAATTQKTNARNPVEGVFDDFGEDVGSGAHASRDSPVIGKLTRVIKPNPQVSNAVGSSHHTFDLDAEKETTSEITSVKVDRKAKGYYTVVRNVMTAHQIQEIGEYQEMDDDVEYILDALQPHNPTPTRCLSALQLAAKCMTPSFRMHVRAHSVVTKFFKALSDANNDLSLGLCTSAIMFILSQEGLNMDLDRDSLELMMNLLECESTAAPSDSANYERNKQKVREFCEEMKAQGKAAHLNMESISMGTLAMETLLSLTSKRAGEWFKEELRELGGLEHIIKTISDCCRPALDLQNSNGTKITWTQSLLENMQTVERCMRVLENVTQMNEENQKYILTFSKGAAVKTLCSLYSLCDREIMLYPTKEHTSRDSPGVVMRELLIPVMKVLINLTHTFNPTKALGAELLGQRQDVFDISFHLLLQAPNYIPDRCIFELSILVLLLLINLCMYTVSNRAAIMKTYVLSELGTQITNQNGKITAVHAVMDYFYKCEELARLVEKNTDAFLDNQEKTKKKQEEVDETVNNLLQKAGHHMEHTLKGSYAGILIGHLITENEDFETVVRSHLRGNGFKEIVNVLEKYYTFMNLTASSEASVVAHIKSTKKIIDYFRKRDLVCEMNDSNDCVLPLNLDTRHTRSSTDGAKDIAETSASSLSTATSTQRGTTQRMYKTYSQR